MDWITEHASGINAISGILTLGVWFFYAQLLYNGYARQRRPRIILNRGEGIGLNAMCLLSNMSNEAIYVQYLVAILHIGEQRYSLELTEYQKSDGDEKYYATHQGPLPSGGYLHAQSFADILIQIQRRWQLDKRLLEEPDTTVSLEMRVIAIYGSEDAPIGATRTFKINMQEAPARQLVPATLDTARLNSRRQRKRVKRWVEEIEEKKAY
ncbi:hypothetical protein R5M92_03425 [Halomonas sp. Bachu 37]|uniref:hypothetical protein n=1 Tax=Halomonas kashgarensis TaxID=3084920 RepID=UPI003216534E